MNEKKILFKNIYNKMMNQFKYKKAGLLLGSVFLYLSNRIGIYSKTTLYMKKVLRFKLTTNDYSLSTNFMV